MISAGRSRSGRVRTLALLSSVSLLAGGVWTASAQHAAIDYVKDSILPASNPVTPSPIDKVEIDVTVPIQDAARASRSAVTLLAGNFYRFEIKGTYIWNKDFSGHIADAECTQYQASKAAKDPTWLRDRFRVAGAAFVPLIRGNIGDVKNWDLRGDPFDVYVNGATVDWEPLTDTGGGCNANDHMYQITFQPKSDGQVRFQVFDPLFRNAKACVAKSASSCEASAGTFAVSIFRGPEPERLEGDELVETVIVDPRQRGRQEVATATALKQDVRHRFVVTGMWDSFQYQGFEGDAECTVAVGPAHETWEAHRFDDRERFPDVYMGLDNGDLLINDREVEWTPLIDTTGKGCNTENHTYRYLFTPLRTKTVKFRLVIPRHSLNGGLLKIDIYRPASITPPEAPEVDASKLALGAGQATSGETLADCTLGSPGAPISAPTAVPCTFTVNAASANGTTVPLPGPAHFRLEVAGIYTWTNVEPGEIADAECSQYQATTVVQDPTWQKNRFGVLGAALAPFGNPRPGLWDFTGDPLDLYVDGSPADWEALTDTGAGCNTRDHAYQLPFSTKGAEQVTFVVNEPFFQNVRASGGLTVKVFPSAVAEPEASPSDLLLATVVVNPKVRMDSTTGISLTKGKLHRFVATGTYKMHIYKTQGDAECSLPDGELNWEAHRYDDAVRFPQSYMGIDNLDLLANGDTVDWVPLLDTGGGCNAKDHAYRLLFTPARTAPVTFRLFAQHHSTNDGLIVVKVYVVGAGLASR